MKQEIAKEIQIPEDVSIELEGSTLNVKGPKGELKKTFFSDKIKIKKENDKIILTAERATKREKKILGSIVAHIKNMILGVREGFEYKLQICSVHFPINVQVDAAKKTLIIKNFLGEVKERTARIPNNVEVKVNGEIITVNSADKELAGQTAARIETATKIKKRDRRIFQDGIYLIEKAGKRI
jgi:large subunit ribosomal protein L6